MSAPVLREIRPGIRAIVVGDEGGTSHWWHAEDVLEGLRTSNKFAGRDVCHSDLDALTPPLTGAIDEEHPSCILCASGQWL